jgi:nicotinamide mononucleotide adenylyltransferase
MIRQLLTLLSARRAHRNSDPYTAEERSLFRSALAEGKSLRRHRRRRVRPALRRRRDPSW